MYKKIGTLIAALLLVHVGLAKVGDKEGSGHNITITVRGYSDTVCYLAGYFGKKQYYKDYHNLYGLKVFVNLREKIRFRLGYTR